jgi:hypothetical protein
MKRILFLTGLLITLAVGVRAQSVTTKGVSVLWSTLPAPNKYVDTVTNTGVKSQVFQISNATGIGIQVVVTKASGTGAGQVNLLGSVDGVNYERIPTLKSNGTVGLDSLTVTNVTTSTHTFQIPKVYHNWYKLTFTGSGTEVAYLTSFASSKNK